MRRTIGLLLALAAALLLLALPAHAGKNKRQAVMAETEVATGTPVSVTLSNGDNTTGYLIVTTANEAATADMVVTVSNSSTLGDVLICTSSSITTDTTTFILLGSLAVAGEGIDDACDFPAGQRVKFTFTTSGVGADFDVTADMEWVVP